uniref:Uncharacterized protein n=1 Tax=Oryza sativa subsp. japonica TaxID=39947 RepID=Q5Z6C1_ORYSJ|nr:hypothetical protein [Oryza sativa Japonica Group]
MLTLSLSSRLSHVSFVLDRSFVHVAALRGGGGMPRRRRGAARRRRHCRCDVVAGGGCIEVGVGIVRRRSRVRPRRRRRRHRQRGGRRRFGERERSRSSREREGGGGGSHPRDAAAAEAATMTPARRWRDTTAASARGCPRQWRRRRSRERSIGEKTSKCWWR